MSQQFNTFRQRPASDSISSLRESGYQAFLRLGFPTRRQDTWQYTTLGNYADLAYLSADGSAIPSGAQELGNPNDINVYLINGYLRGISFPASKTVPGLTIKALEQAFLDESDVVRGILESQSNRHENGFTAINQAFLGPGVLVQIAENCRVEPLIHIIHWLECEDARTAHQSRVVIDLGAMASASVVETFRTASPDAFANSVATIRQLAGSQLRHHKLQLASIDATVVDHTTVDLRENSHYECFTGNLGGKLVRSAMGVELNGEFAKADLSGVYMPKGSQKIDQVVAVAHTIGNTNSSQFFKGILADSSKALFHGRIRVAKGAQGSEARQLNKNLMLSDTAELNTLPQLEIDADDIKCSHGAAIGQIRDDELFYLQSRGISRDIATAMLARAFVEEAALHIADRRVQALVLALLRQAL